MCWQCNSGGAFALFLRLGIVNLFYVRNYLENRKTRSKLFCKQNLCLILLPKWRIETLFSPTGCSFLNKIPVSSTGATVAPCSRQKGILLPLT
jgi:hypothetical protein